MRWRLSQFEAFMYGTPSSTDSSSYLTLKLSNFLNPISILDTFIIEKNTRFVIWEIQRVSGFHTNSYFLSL